MGKITGRPVGRPRKEYLPEYAAKASELAVNGATDPEIAQFFGVGLNTYYNWLSRHSDFSKAIREAKGQPDDRVVRSTYQRACGFFITKRSYQTKANDQGDLVVVAETFTQEYFPPDTGACAFWLKNRRPHEWREKIDGVFKHEHSGTLTHRLSRLDPRELDALPVDEIQARYAEALAASGEVLSLPSPDRFRDEPVQAEHSSLDRQLGMDK